MKEKNNSEEKEKILIEINNNLKSLVSRKDNFIRGIITGVATAIGATIIAGILIGVVASVAKNYNIPIIDQIAPK